MTVPTLEAPPEIAPEAPPENAPQVEPEGTPIAAPQLASDGSGTGNVNPPADDAERKRKRRFILLFILGILAIGLLLFTAWYLLFRKPISEILPPITNATPPGYQYSLYGMTSPLGVAVTLDGSRLYVTETSGTQETLILDNRGTKLGVLAPPADVAAHANQLYVAIDPKTGDIYATDRAAGAVYVYAADGTYKQAFDSGAAIDGWQPLGIAFDSKGDLFVADAGGTAQTVHEFGPDGAPIRDFVPATPFLNPNGIATDAAGNVYVTDSNNGRTVVFDQGGKEIGAVNRGPGAGELGLPRGIVADDKGRVYVVDAVAQNVLMFQAIQAGETAPKFLVRFGQEGTTDGAFEYPNGIALDSRGHVYVTDWNNDRLQVWGF